MIVHRISILLLIIVFCWIMMYQDIVGNRLLQDGIKIGSLGSQWRIHHNIFTMLLIFGNFLRIFIFLNPGGALRHQPLSLIAGTT